MGGDDKKNDDGKYHEYYILKLSFLVRSKTLLKILIYWSFKNCFLLFLERLNSDVLQGQAEVEEEEAVDSVAVEWEDVVEEVVEEDLEEAGMRETIVEDGVEAEVVSTMELSKYLFNQSDFSES